MTGATDACAVGMLGEQVPAAVWLAVPVAAVVQVAKAPVVHGAGMAARRPLTMDFAMAVAAILPFSWVRIGLDPIVLFAVVGRKTLQRDGQGDGIRSDTGNEIALLPGGHSCRQAGRPAELKFPLGPGENRLGEALNADTGTRHRAIGVR